MEPFENRSVEENSNWEVAEPATSSNYEYTAESIHNEIFQENELLKSLLADDISEGM